MEGDSLKSIGGAMVKMWKTVLEGSLMYKTCLLGLTMMVSLGRGLAVELLVGFLDGGVQLGQGLFNLKVGT